jgi:hypothetical protein
MSFVVFDTQLDAVKGESNVFDLDANIVLVAAQDKFWFSLKTAKDADVFIVQKTENVGVGDGGIVVTSEANGQFTVTLDADDLADVEERALVWDCKVKVASTGVIQTVASGTMLLADAVNTTAS